MATGGLPSAESGYRDHPDDRIWDIGDISNAELAGHIAEARLDVLIDLNGYSDLARLPLLLHRAAPVQICLGQHVCDDRVRDGRLRGRRSLDDPAGGGAVLRRAGAPRAAHLSGVRGVLPGPRRRAAAVG